MKEASVLAITSFAAGDAERITNVRFYLWSNLRMSSTPMVAAVVSRYNEELSR
jgi:hypothetical protein